VRERGLALTGGARLAEGGRERARGVDWVKLGQMAE
jgi:hypothetical protein